ncbi:MAG: YkgJ family cysteine cluster protein [Cyanobacteria bacterium HKST-UBA06]|nr:YkgJ family cysteine cluster protein [Cyanobacteria bacterium HKST-UBA05]MCA9800167.1 YkgJ family cysteine cluster protein [Cyanobacteria bacterium HKST-UBA04]MCA9807490.1 YkgJ family cysteine cluster protein [Cyanobacteria bacterium HKST-UBA06]
MFNSQSPQQPSLSGISMASAGGAAGKTPADMHDLPDLCHKCGRCCRSATTFNSYPKLLELVEQGDQEAIDFLEIFEPFDSVEQARAVVPEQVQRVIDEVSHRKDMHLDELTFYHCRYVTEEGMCGIYERRPRCCSEAPYHGWSMMPPGCGFEGWQFEQREMQKAEIRKLKEIQYQMEALSPDGIRTASGSMTLDELRGKINEALAPWKTFGSQHW